MPVRDVFKRKTARYKKADAGQSADGGSMRRRASRFAKGAMLVLVLLLCALPVVLLADPITYVPFIMVIFMVVLSYVYVRVLRSSLVFDEGGLVPSCERGQKAPLSVKLTNSSFLPHPKIEMNLFISDLFGGYDSIVPLTTVLGPHESSDFSFDAQFIHLGRYEVGVDRVVIHDLIGLFTSTIEGASKHTVLVHPRTVDLVDVDFRSVTLQESSSMFKPMSCDDMDYASVREYRIGDPLKTVHWNLSSRTPDQTLYTRLFEIYTNPSMAIIIDPYSPEYDKEDLMSVFDGLVETASSVSAFAHEQGVECDLRYIDKDGQAEVTHLTTFSDADALVMGMKSVSLAASDPIAASEPADMLRREGLSSQGASNLVYCTSRLSEDVLSTMMEIKGHHRNPMLFLAIPRTLEGRERKEFLKPLARLAATDVPYYLIESTEETTRVVSK